MIKVENLTKYYGSTRALNNVSFSIKKGTVVGFLGPNGAGKTTTMKILTGFMPASSGRVQVAGFDVNEDVLEVRRNIGYLPESAPLYTDLNVWEYLSFIAAMRQIQKNKRTARLKDVLEVCGLKDRLRSEISELSKGYKQRVGLAATLIHDPSVLILDEPTSGLDPNQIVEIRGLIKKIGSIGKKTVILSTHILSEVESTCDYAMIINKGEIVAQGSPNELRDLGSGANRVIIEAEGSFKDLATVLEKVAGVIGVNKDENIEHLRGIARMFVEVEKGSDARKEIGLALFQSGHPLLELKREDVSLESVFTQLTKE